MRNIEKNCLQGLKRQNKLFANTICKTSEKSDKLLKIISSKTEIKSKSNNFLLQILSTQDLQIEQAH